MKNKGFTLIELLAVIVILAIIALIATPIVLGIIEDSKESANRVSAQYIIDSVEKAWAIAYTQNNGAKPTLDAVQEHFDMSGAEWTVSGDTHSISTTDGEVTCTVNGTTAITVTCTGYDDLTSETMELSTAS